MKLICTLATSKPKEMNTIIESKTDMGDIKNLVPVAKNLRKISIMKNKRRMKLSHSNKLFRNIPRLVVVFSIY